MAGGWTRDSAVQDQIYDTIKDAGEAPTPPGRLTYCVVAHRDTCKSCSGTPISFTEQRQVLPVRNLIETFPEIFIGQ